MIIGEGTSWSTVQYMICEAQNGRRITDDIDRLLFNTYGTAWLGAQCFGTYFAFEKLHHLIYAIPALQTEVVKSTSTWTRPRSSGSTPTPT